MQKSSRAHFDVLCATAAYHVAKDILETFPDQILSLVL
jgi:hypothetical protein